MLSQSVGFVAEIKLNLELTVSVHIARDSFVALRKGIILLFFNKSFSYCKHEVS